ncbi:histidine kinase dimerization/phosphoacceptor domain -containing protein, partial [Escherichia coli]|uniref:histidine kinase dimerization/phosphoacceptor domain -containing protein n=1 Tax=Escherichia coli TaxID=562 RepID=UPI00278C303E
TLLALRTRINALALIHRNLYENHDLQLVDLDGFLPMLCNQLQDLSAAGRRHVAIRTAVPRLSVPADAAVTLSMLLTEIVSSTVKQLRPGDTAV